MNVISYLRLSKKSEESAGLGLQAQREYVAMAAKAAGWNVVAEFVDDGVSGTIALEDRPEGSKALALCKELNAPLVVAKLDRIGRDVEHVARLIKMVDFRVATMLHADKFQLHLFAALAEQERSFIAQRTKDALAALKQDAEAGNAEALAKVSRRAEYLSHGRTDANRAKARAVVADRVNSFHESIRSEFEACLYRGQKSLRAVADCLNARNVTTSRGGQWSAVQVSRVMQSLQLSFPE
nr:recombinase family protein [Pseudomonas sp. s4]